MHLAAFKISNYKRSMNTFIRKNNGFHATNVIFSDTDSLYFERRYWDVLNEAKLV